ncbi:hypothetical protein BKA70DRAFT_241591 [Coprinopsis sp. MPI-PUGE-AT-0042]|nr:hypothetical protein BKA70DRAFT_241591 [Coprinopsis sp. MPI-PUGE-AT-0042]
MVPGRLSTPGCFVTIASSPYPPGRSSTSLRISRFMQEERYPTIPLLGARKTVERHHVPQHSDSTSENLFRMTTRTISLVHIAATATTTVVPNSFPIDGQVIILHHKTSCPMLARGPMLVRLIRPRWGHRKESLLVRALLPQELEAQPARRGMKRREFYSASRCVASKGVLLSSTSTPVHPTSGHSGGWKLEQLAASVEYPSAGVPQHRGAETHVDDQKVVSSSSTATTTTTTRSFSVVYEGYLRNSIP